MASVEAKSLPKIDSRLKKLARQSCAELPLTDPAEVEVRNWVRWKCQFGCKGFAKHFSCPPYVPSPSETKVPLQKYDRAYFVHFVGIPVCTILARQIFSRTGIRFFES
jgi:predicted metal-binding protein